MMISISEAISDLLFVRDTVVVPGLGAFVKKAVPAQVNSVASYFAMPSATIEFDANLREDNELLIRYLSEKNEISEDEAKKRIAMFVSDCFNTLKNKRKVLLSSFGTLSYDLADNLVFEQDKSVNYNADAFGLCDFSPEPILRSKTKDEIRAEIAQQQKDKNTPVTVDEKAVHEHDREDHHSDEDDEPHRFWLWLLLGLLLLTGIGFGLQYFKVVDFRQWFERFEKPEEVEPWKVVVPDEVDTWSTEVEVEANILIIAGCFDQEEYAIRLTNTLKEKGYTGAFYELRNNKWFVSFGRYATDEEALTVLREIRAKNEYKAWILSL